MAKIWIPKHSGPSDVLSGAGQASDLLSNYETATGRKAGDFTSLRIRGVLHCRVKAPTNVWTDVFFTILKRDIDFTSGDLNTTQLTTLDHDVLWTDLVAVVGIAGDSTAATNLTPVYTIPIDVRVKRKFTGFGGTLWMLVRNVSGETIEYGLYTRTLVLLR